MLSMYKTSANRRLCSALGLVLLAPCNLNANVCVYKPLTVNYVCGVTVDQQDRPIANANLSILKGDALLSEQQSAPDGTFNFPKLAPGKYNIRIKASGFSSGYYSITIAKPVLSCKRLLRVQLNIGGADCPGDIEVKKIPGSKH
jgi:hypothetical protein